MLNELIVNLDHLDHTIRLFDPDCDVALARPKQFPPRHQAFRGEIQRFVLGALRAASEPVTSLEVAIEVVKGRGLDPNDPRAVSLIRKRVGACLLSLKAKGTARDVPRPARTRAGSWWLRQACRRARAGGPQSVAMPSTTVAAHDSATSERYFSLTLSTQPASMTKLSR